MRVRAHTHTELKHGLMAPTSCWNRLGPDSQLVQVYVDPARRLGLTQHSPSGPTAGLNMCFARATEERKKCHYKTQASYRYVNRNILILEQSHSQTFSKVQ